MALNYYYNYAEIDPETNMCVGVISCTIENTGDDANPYWVEIPVYDEEYGFKYYNWENGKFYYDSEYTQEYISPLL